MTISKSLTLQGEDKTTTIIDGSGSGSVVQLTSTNNVIISDFIIKGGNRGIFFYSSTYNTVKNIIITNNGEWGIDVGDRGSNHNTFQNIEAYSNTGTAINAYAGSNYLKVLDSNLYNNGGCGIQIGWSSYWSFENNIIHSNSCGINIDTARYGTVKNNDIYSNTNGGGTATGIGFGGWGPYYNTIVGNKIHSNDWGIVFGCQARYNKIKENQIYDNSIGVYNTKNGGYPNYANTFYYNDFKGNTINAKNDEDRVGYTDTWDNGYPSGGNYWDDYTGSDLNSGAGQNVPGSDGIGDTPRVINVLDTDRYPLMRPWNTHAPVVNAGSDQTVSEGDTVIFSGSFTDADPADTPTISWDFGDGSASVTGTLTPMHVYADNGVYTVTLTVTDSNGGTGYDTLSVTVNNVAPTATFAATGPINEGSSSTLSLVNPSDPGTADTDAGFHYSFACDGLDSSLASTYASSGTASTAACAFNDNSDHTVKSRIFDKDDGYTTYEATVSVNNVAPVITSTTGPSGPLALGSSAGVTASFTDAGSLDTHTCTISWDDGTYSSGTITESGGSGSCTGSRTYAAAGVYSVAITISDDDAAGATSKFEYVVVYDPNGGFVTGGGWINSPAGAYTADPAMTGRANFGFVSKYQKGANKPTGETEFQFKAGNLNFHSTVYEWLVVAGAKAQYKGSGTINGAGDYGFLLTATDGQVSGGGGVDKFRIKIVDKVAGTVVYDNVHGVSDDLDAADPQAIGGGSIVVHK